VSHSTAGTVVLTLHPPLVGSTMRALGSVRQRWQIPHTTLLYPMLQVPARNCCARLVLEHLGLAWRVRRGHCTLKVEIEGILLPVFNSVGLIVALFLTSSEVSHPLYPSCPARRNGCPSHMLLMGGDFEFADGVGAGRWTTAEAGWYLSPTRRSIIIRSRPESSRTCD
jgi:hypothetical protein